MNVLILGSGGREHAIAWKIAQSTHLEHLFIAPGNAGTATVGENVGIDPMDFEVVAEFAKRKDIGIIIVGPEAPLVAGIYDFFQSREDLESIKIVGPSKAGAQLEGSKSFAKIFMEEFNIPTAKYGKYTADTVDLGVEHILEGDGPYVLKADGLAAGKGVLIIEDRQEAVDALREMLDGQFGDASSTVVIEDFLSGIEFSVFVLTDGDHYHILPVAKDYKRIGEGDTGLNTGGMGAVSPVPFVDDVMMDKVEQRIIKPTIEGLKKRNIAYKGFIFFGLIEVKGEPMVIEYNCRMGDPETEVVMPRIQSDLLDLMMKMDTNDFEKATLDIDPRFATTVMLVSGGYPGNYEKGKAIQGTDLLVDQICFHAGTKMVDGKVHTNGGRVLAITGYGEFLQEALDASYSGADNVSFDGMYYRKDIGFDLKHQ